MTRSESINELASALAKAQAVMTGAKKDSDNPFFKSHYADLASVRDACMPALNAHGLSVLQFPRLVSAGDHEWLIEVETVLAHASGQFIADTLAVPVTKADAQGVGSAITYARRYALGAVAGVAAEDDDGESAVGRTVHKAAKPVGKFPADNNQYHAGEPEPAKGAGLSVVAKVEDVRQKAGTSKAGKPFTKYTVKADGHDFNTFDRELAEWAKMSKARGVYAELTYKEGQYGRDLLAIADVLESDAMLPLPEDPPF